MKNMKTNSPLAANEKMTTQPERQRSRRCKEKACQDQILLPSLDMHRRKALTAMMVMNDNRRHCLT